MVVFAFFTIYSIVMILHEVIRPRTIPPFWFGGVTLTKIEKLQEHLATENKIIVTPVDQG